MSSRQFDEEYEEYRKRRDREQQPNRARSGRFKPVSREGPPKATLSEEKRAMLKGNGNFDIPNNVYQSSGYQTRKSELGEDPLSTVRTLRNQLRCMAIQYQKDDVPVRVHLCERACDRLTAVEGELLALSRQRTNAVLNGDTAKVEKISKKMEELKEDAVRDTYSDLVMDKNEMKALGVNSQWTPIKRSEETKPVAPAPPPPPPAKKIARPTPVTSETQTEAMATPRPKQPEKIPEDPPRDVKRNARLEALLAAAEAERQSSAQLYDNPYELPSYAGTCEFCGECSPDFGLANRLESHYKTSCQLMSKCRFCSKVVVVSQLNDHLINRCTFLAGRMTSCSACGMAIDVNDNTNGVGHPMCRGRPPPSGAQWCPLCAVAVSDKKEAWTSHLMNDCYNNPRRNGPEIELETLPDFLEKNTRPSSSASTKALNRARLIDADKLVAALQEVQLRKKQEAKKKAAAMEK